MRIRYPAIPEYLLPVNGFLSRDACSLKVTKVQPINFPFKIGLPHQEKSS